MRNRLPGTYSIPQGGGKRPVPLGREVPRVLPVVVVVAPAAVVGPRGSSGSGASPSAGGWGTNTAAPAGAWGAAGSGWGTGSPPRNNIQAWLGRSRSGCAKHELPHVSYAKDRYGIYPRHMHVHVRSLWCSSGGCHGPDKGVHRSWGI
jgi:hypothetical protein